MADIQGPGPTDGTAGGTGDVGDQFDQAVQNAKNANPAGEAAGTGSTPYVTPKPLDEGKFTHYPRVIELQNAKDENGASLKGAFLATDSEQLKPGFNTVDNPIYRTQPGSDQFEKLTTLETGKPNVGDYSATSSLFEKSDGNVLLAVRAGEGDAAQIDVYNSGDGGKSWDFVSSPDLKANANGSMWEPEIKQTADGNLAMYFSDETNKFGNYNQSIGHFTSADGGKTWENPTLDVGITRDVNNDSRPGMPRVTHSPNGPYVMAFEAGGTDDFRLHVKTSPDGLNWGDPTNIGAPVISDQGGTFRTSSDIEYSPAEGGELVAAGKQFIPGPNGSVDAEGRQRNGEGVIFVTKDLTGQSGWQERYSSFPVAGASTPTVEGSSPAPNGANYSPVYLPTADGKSLLQASTLEFLQPNEPNGGYGAVATALAPFPKD